MRLWTTVICWLALAPAAAAFESFFPLQRLHAVDGPTRRTEVSVEGCALIVTQVQRRGYQVTWINLADLLTAPDAVRLLATLSNNRMLVVWRADPSRIDGDMPTLATELRANKVHHRDHANPDPTLRREKEARLRQTLNDVRQGAHGEYARRNHRASYLGGRETALWEIFVPDTLTLPVRTSQAADLVEAIDHHRQDHCPTPL